MSGSLPFVIGGRNHLEWFDAFTWSFVKGVDGVTPELREWPTGGTYAEQDNLVVGMFSILRDEVKTINKREAEKKTRGKANG